MTNKNPFEVRLDVLQMAREMLDKEKELEEQKFKQQVETLRTTNIGHVNTFIQENAPKMYTADDVKARANSLYEFVNSSRTR